MPIEFSIPLVTVVLGALLGVLCYLMLVIAAGRG